MDNGFQGLPVQAQPNMAALASQQQVMPDGLLQAIRQYSMPSQQVSPQMEAQYSAMPQQQVDPLVQSAQQYQAYMAMGRPDLARQTLEASGMPEPTWGDKVKSVVFGTPNSGLDEYSSLFQKAMPVLIGLYKNYMAQQQWANNPQTMANVAANQMGNMQSSFGLNRR